MKFIDLQLGLKKVEKIQTVRKQYSLSSLLVVLTTKLHRGYPEGFSDVAVTICVLTVRSANPLIRSGDISFPQLGDTRLSGVVSREHYSRLCGVLGLTETGVLNTIPLTKEHYF